MFDTLYNVRLDEKQAFGKHWCGPKKYAAGDKNLIAVYEKTSSDGQTVKVYCTPMPARFYSLEVDANPAYTISTGSSQAKLAALVAENIAKNMLSVEFGKGDK